MTRHRHKVAHRSDDDSLHAYGFTGCVAPWNCEPSSHGCISYEEYCACGAARSVNQNQHWAERSAWKAPPTWS